MDRLTFEGNFCDIAQCEATPGGSFCEDGTCDVKKVWERLKEYEDTGYAPDAIVTVGRLDEALARHDTTPERLVELMEADKEGRVVVLPCKVGDMVYWTLGAKITECRVYRIQISRGDIDIFVKTDDLPETPCIGLTYGENLFLTREEAEKALEARSHEVQEE